MTKAVRGAGVRQTAVGIILRISANFGSSVSSSLQHGDGGDARVVNSVTSENVSPGLRSTRLVAAFIRSIVPETETADARPKPERRYFTSSAAISGDDLGITFRGNARDSARTAARGKKKKKKRRKKKIISDAD